MVALLEGWESPALEDVMARHLPAWNRLSFSTQFLSRVTAAKLKNRRSSPTPVRPAGPSQLSWCCNL
jgi:hypothetical protein